MRDAADEPGVSFGILGPLVVEIGGQPLSVPGRRRRALLCRLLIAPNRLVSAGRLIEDIWGEAPPDNPVNALQSYVSSLRSLLEPDRSPRDPPRVIVTRKPGYLAVVSPDGLDSIRFERLSQEGRKWLSEGRPDDAANILHEALGLWHGHALEEFSAEPWAATEGARLDELRWSALEDRIEADLALGRHTAVVAEVEIAVTEQPLRERLRGLLMLALYRGGRQADALRAFADLRRALAEELGIPPSPELQRLEESIILQKSELDYLPPPPRSAPAVAAAQRSEVMATARPALPADLTSLVGREADAAAVRELLSSTRLLTLTGLGGIGKTRLALRVASTVSAAFVDGIYFVEFASLTEPSLVAAHVRSALRIPDDGATETYESLVAHLNTRRALLVLDNCEHVVKACADLCQTILRGCPGVVILATSRQPLRVTGERPWPVPPLSSPDPERRTALPRVRDHEAVQLFLERATSVTPSLEVGEQDAHAVARICHELDGIPLALELAASATRVLSIPEIADRLEKRLHLVASATRDAPERHRTMQVAIGWTYDLLSEKERRLFERLTVFVGTFTLEAAEVVCTGDDLKPDEVLELLARLIDQSLVTRIDHEHSRYRILEIVRQHGMEKLSESGADFQLRTRQLDWAVRLAERSVSGTHGPAAHHWLKTLDAEQGNLRAALSWAETCRRPDLTVRLVIALQDYWKWRGRVAEGRAWLERLLAKSLDLTPTIEGTARTVAGILANSQGDFSGGRLLLSEGLALSRQVGDDENVVRALTALSQVAINVGDYSEAHGHLEECLELCIELGDRAGLANALQGLGNLAALQCDFGRARTLLGESQTIREELGDRASVARARAYLGQLLLFEGRHGEAERYLQDGLDILKGLGDYEGTSIALIFLAEVHRVRGDVEKAESVLCEVISIVLPFGHRPRFALCFERLAQVASQKNELTRAARLLGAATSMTGRAGVVPNRFRRETLESTVAATREGLGHVAFEAAWEQGRRMSEEDAVQFALTPIIRAPENSR